MMVIAMLLISCTSKENTYEDKIKPVELMQVTKESQPLLLEYMGNISTEEMKKLAFKSSGRLAKVHVKEGQQIKTGDLLLELDTEDLEYALRASEAQLKGAEAQYHRAVNGATEEEKAQVEMNVKKARDAYHFTQEQHKKLELLYKDGAISKNDLDKIKLELDLREAEYNQASQAYEQIKKGAREEDKQALKAQLDQASIDYEAKRSLVKDGKMISNVDGYVVELLFKEGELVSAGYPAIIIRNQHQVAVIGVTNKDLDKVQIGIKARVKVDDQEAIGAVSTISQIPDPQTRTYAVEIDLGQSKLPLGAIAQVELIIGEEQGIWIPITAIMSNEIDYVYVIEDEQAVKRKIEIESIRGTKVKVNGIHQNEKLVIQGMKHLINGDKVSVQ